VDVDMIFKRKVMTLIKEVINNPEIIILTGMRRVGKTTLYKYLFEDIKSDNKVFFDLKI
jgi:predicted AAA+ superfamily ATPase